MGLARVPFCVGPEASESGSPAETQVALRPQRNANRPASPGLRTSPHASKAWGDGAMAASVRSFWRSGWRRAVGIIAAYALLLQASLAGAISHPSQAGAGPFDPLAVICVIDGGKAHTGLPEQPPANSGHRAHPDCGLCTVAAPALALALAVVLDLFTPDRANILPAAADQVAHPAIGALPGRPRAPPIV